MTKPFKPRKKTAVAVKSAAAPAELATMKEAVDFLKFDERTIRNRAKAGDIPGSRLVFGRWRFPWQSLREIAGVG